MNLMMEDVFPTAGSKTKSAIGGAAVALLEKTVVKSVRDSNSAATTAQFNFDSVDDRIFIPHFFSWSSSEANERICSSLSCASLTGLGEPSTSD